MKISFALALALAATTVPAIAQPATDSAAAAPSVAKGATIFSADGRRVGRVDRVRPTGVSLIYNGKFIEIPLDTISSADKGYTTSLNKAALAKL